MVRKTSYYTQNIGFMWFIAKLSEFDSCIRIEKHPDKPAYSPGFYRGTSASLSFLLPTSYLRNTTK